MSRPRGRNSSAPCARSRRSLPLQPPPSRLPRPSLAIPPARLPSSWRSDRFAPLPRAAGVRSPSRSSVPSSLRGSPHDELRRQSSRPARSPAATVVTAAVTCRMGTSSRSGRGGSARPGKSPEYYSGTSLRRPPPPRDPARDPRLPLPGSPGDCRRLEAARADRSSLSELVARPLASARDELAP
ncbi:hypothetical protein ZWY2020_024901 [Hordeum vulgare]|nr:hypothetical protein ZWY2020_024901 [Hordeum vulgare]